MKTVAVICEYNPLHFGHIYHIRKIREDFGDCAVVAIISGDFVQRGEPALLSKFARAELAIHGGCDLALELPSPYCFGSAEYFAKAGVSIAAALGADVLSFGSESGNLSELEKAACMISDKNFKNCIDEVLCNNRSFGIVSARCAAARKLGAGHFPDLITSPNNILALEYINANNKTNYGDKLELHTVQRIGEGYNSLSNTTGLVSASYIRNKIFANEPFEEVVPVFTAEVCNSNRTAGLFPANIKHLELPILSFFRLANPDQLSEYAEAGGGLSHRLCKAARDADSLETFFEAAATKKYTNARLRRSVLSCMLGVYESDLRSTPGFTRLLAANQRGRQLLAQLRSKSEPYILTSAADFKKLPSSYTNFLKLYRDCESLYTLSFKSPRAASIFMKCKPYIAQN